MKKTMILAALMMGGFLFQQAAAQVKVNLSVNLGRQPVWGPAGYDEADYYYLPDADCYYDINRQQFIYNSNNRWIYASQLPPRYRNVDLYSSYKVVVNEPRPYMHADVYRAKYRNNKGPRERQVIIRDSREEKYYQVKGHPMHKQWAKNHPNDDRNGNGHDKDRDHGRH
jgi:hypothetical protein